MKQSPRLLAILQAVFVTFLWSTSWILIKWNIDEIPPLTFAGLRYSLAFVFLAVYRRLDAVLDLFQHDARLG